MNLISWIKNKPLKACTTFNFFTTVLTFIAVSLFGHKGLYLLASTAAIVIIFSTLSFIRAKSFFSGIANLFVVLITQAIAFGVVCAIGFSVALFLSIDPTKPMKWHKGERVENFFESSHFERLEEFGITKKIDDKPIHSSYYYIADDYGFDTFLELSKDDLSEFLPKSIELVDHDTFTNGQENRFPSTYFLCDEDTNALISDERLMKLICNDDKTFENASFFNKTKVESELTFDLVYFPKEQVLWLHFVKW